MAEDACISPRRSSEQDRPPVVPVEPPERPSVDADVFSVGCQITRRTMIQRLVAHAVDDGIEGSVSRCFRHGREIIVERLMGGIVDNLRGENL